MVNIVEILAKVGKNNLVLLDELGAGTDPVEGAALAMAIIDTLLQKEAKMIVTTHCELKAYAFNHPKLANASVEFDIDTLRPTYRLLMGIPGRSNAFDIALSLGVGENVVAKADQYMSKEAKEVQNFLANLETNRAAAEQAKDEAESLKIRMENLEREVSQREKALALREAQIMDKARERAENLVREKKREADALLAELKNLWPKRTLENKKRPCGQPGKNQAHRRYGAGMGRSGFRRRRSQGFSAGDEVYLPRLKKNGIVLEVLNEQEVQVQAGIMKIKMKVKELRKPQVSKSKPIKAATVIWRPAKQRGQERIGSPWTYRRRGADGTEKFLDDAFLANLPSVRIIHGLGTGVLKKMVYDTLKTHAHVESQRLGGYYEGGAGVSIAQIIRENSE